MTLRPLLCTTLACVLLTPAILAQPASPLELDTYVDEVRAAFEEELGIGLGETTADGQITLTRTACIGMSDQAPAALKRQPVEMAAWVGLSRVLLNLDEFITRE